MATAGQNDMKHRTGINGLSNRWVRSNLLITILILLAAEILLMFYTVNASYSAAYQTLRSEIALLSSRFTAVETASERERSALLRTMVQEVAARQDAAYTLQLLDAQGGLYATSDGFLPVGAASVPEDLTLARSAQNRLGEAMQADRNGPRTIAITWLIPAPVRQVAAVRLVTSLQSINQWVLQVLGISLAVLAACFGLILFTGMYFVRSIVRPLAQVEATATKIAGGNFDIRLDKKHNDEIGRLCETINHMAEELSKTERLKNDFISSVSHELRTPLTSIKGWTETLQQVDDVHDANYARGMRIISGETDRLYGMVEELLDFSRMQNKGLSLTFAPLDLAAEAGEAVLMVQQRAAQAGVELIYEEPEAVLAVSGDANRLRQVLLNLLDNALKYSPAGSTLQVRAYAQGDKCCVSVTDQGPGIAPDELELVKTRFYKGRGAVRGSGIGLAVADEILRGHGGQLLLQSTLGQGTTATILLNAIS